MHIVSNIKQVLKKKLPALYSSYLNYHRQRLPAKVVRILSDSHEPTTLNENEFDKLQLNYKQWWPKYEYDAYSTGRRAYERALSFFKLESLRQPGKNVLEIGCGDGMTGATLSIFDHQVTLLDYQDWRDDRAQKEKFIPADLDKPIMLPDSSFDFIFCFNVFEHISNPALAIKEMVRILRPGGHIWLDFNPLYASPLGLHAFNFNMPYPQFLFSQDLITKKLHQLGNNDLGKNLIELQAINHWKANDFEKLFRNCGCKVVEYIETLDYKQLDIINNYPQAFSGRNLSLRDVTAAGIFCILKKTDSNCPEP